MKNLIRQMSGRLKDAPLQQKIMLLVVFVLILTTAGSVAGFRLIFSSGNRMLYESMAGSLSYSASAITEKLQNIEAMTGFMLADSKIQNTLTVVSDENDSEKRNNAYRTLSALVPDYYQNFKQNGIRYMNLYNSDYVTYSYLSRSNATPGQVHDKAIEAAHTASGAPAWTTDYCNEYGLFLSRDVRRAAQLKLDTLGTIVVAVDLEGIIDSSSRNIFKDRMPDYVLFRDGKEIYRSSRLALEDTVKLGETAGEPYGVVTLEGTPFFYVRGTISQYGWDYLCLSSYEEIAHAQRLYILLSLLIILAALLAGLFVSRRLIGSITIHFKRLLKKMADFGRDESVLPVTDYDYTDRADEIGELHRRFDQMALKVQKLIETNYVNELLTREAQLKALENQMNPHFLYNTLESLNWRAKALGAKDMSAMVEALGALLRTTLSQKEDTSTLRQELKTVDYYMTIIKIRFSDRVRYVCQVPGPLMDIRLPNLTLQPLVENAVNYAMEEITETCTIVITAEVAEPVIYIKVTNNGSQFPPDILDHLSTGKVKPHGFGIGLLNIHKRLKLYYGPEYGLTLRNEDDDHAAVIVTLPAAPKS